jgi:poly-gamma-glutamate synthesis protein (capsule biosynthesis protein)
MIYASQSGNFSIALGGDALLTRPLRIFDEPAYLDLAKIIRDCDAGFVNLETVVRNLDEGEPGITAGTFMTTPPELLEDLKWIGVNLVNCANNHMFDYGGGGLLATIRHLDAAGIAHAGSGANLAEARRPGYCNTKGGRVALIGATAAYRTWNAAGAQRQDIVGRVGVNPFPSKTTYTVDDEAFRALQRINRELGFERTRERNATHFYSAAELGSAEATRLTIFGQTFAKGESFGASAAGSQDDIEDILRWVREARRMADWVVVSFHTHDFSQAAMAKARTRIELEEPADYLPEFARLAIDAGADIVAGHGSHTPLGIDLYKGKPIFYSLGNFIMQNETLTAFPDVAYRRFGLGPDATPSDFLDARTDGGKKGHVAHAGFWENFLVTCHFTGGALSEIRVNPIDLGHTAPRSQRGRPVLARDPVASRVVERVARLSKPYGVKVENRNGTGVVTL